MEIKSYECNFFVHLYLITNLPVTKLKLLRKTDDLIDPSNRNSLKLYKKPLTYLNVQLHNLVLIS